MKSTIGKVLGNILTILTIISLNSACIFITYQPDITKLLENTKKE